MIRLGPAGSWGLGNLEGIKQVKKLGLQAMEVEFTHGVNMKTALAKEVGKAAKKLDVSLSVHAPYFCNLASLEPQKRGATRKRILDSCERGHLLGARYIVFHAGFYQGRDRAEVYDIMLEQIGKLQEVIREKKYDVVLAPETTGKPTQFGDLNELLRLRKDTGCELCIDFAHMLAREGKRDYDEIFSKIKNFNHIHSHFSGIEYSEKGERRHLITEIGDIKELLSHVIKNKVDITIINESPDPFGDALKTKKILESPQ